MMGTLAGVLAAKNIPTIPENLYWVDVEGDIEKVNDIPKITRIRATFHLKVPEGKEQEAEDAFSAYLVGCPAAQSVIGCIEIVDNLALM
jgi:hypothetical protein